MGRRRGISTGSAAVLCGLLLAVAVRAQQPPLPARCLPQPQKSPKTKLSIDQLQVVGAELPAGLSQWQFTAMLEQQAQSGDAGWLNRVRNAAREEWRASGYFRTVVNVQKLADSVTKGVRRVSLRIRVDPGPLYRVQEVRMLNVNPGGKLLFANQKLRDLVPLLPGEPVDVQRAEQGVEAIRALYASHGYIDVRATPSFQVEDGQDRISLLVMLDPGKQYRVGKITILGFSSSQQAMLKEKIKSGDIFDWNVVKDFYSEHQWLMPTGASVSDDHIDRDAKTNTVDLLLDFRACPEPKSPTDKNEPSPPPGSR